MFLGGRGRPDQGIVGECVLRATVQGKACRQVSFWMREVFEANLLTLEGGGLSVVGAKVRGARMPLLSQRETLTPA